MLYEPVRSCTRCNLASLCRRPVPGEGNPSASLFGVGQSPGEDEDLSGHPFRGRSGVLLRETLSRFGIPVEEVYLTNAGKCHPPGNKKYLKAQQAACLPWLEAELALWTPPEKRLIVAVGADALQAMCPKLSLSEGRSGNLVDYAGHPLTAILHPAAVLRNPRNRPAFEADVERVAQYLGYAGAQAPYWANYRLNFVPDDDDPLWTGDLGLDTEFGYPERDSLIGWSYSWAPGLASYVTSADGLRSAVFRSRSLILHSVQADVPIVCRALGMGLDEWPWHKTFDTCIAAYVRREKNVALKALTFQHFGVSTLHFEDVAKDPEEFSQLDPEVQLRYAAADPDFTRRLWFERYAESLRGAVPGDGRGAQPTQQTLFGRSDASIR